jgi:hypothetical protein
MITEAKCISTCLVEVWCDYVLIVPLSVCKHLMDLLALQSDVVDLFCELGTVMVSLVWGGSKHPFLI